MGWVTSFKIDYRKGKYNVLDLNVRIIHTLVRKVRKRKLRNIPLSLRLDLCALQVQHYLKRILVKTRSLKRSLLQKYTYCDYSWKKVKIYHSNLSINKSNIWQIYTRHGSRYFFQLVFSWFFWLLQESYKGFLPSRSPSESYLWYWQWLPWFSLQKAEKTSPKM